MSTDIAVESYLAHYGVKGMRWGVRKKEDTSNRKTRKTEEKQAKREIRAKKHDDKGAAYQKRIDDLVAKKGNTSSRIRKNLIDGEIKDLTKDRDRAFDDASRVREGKLTKTQKKVAIGASVVAAIIVARAGYKMADGGEFHRLSTKGKAFMEGRSATAFKRNEVLARPDLDVTQIRLAVVSKINPDYGSVGTHNNCRRATFAYEMRRRGYDVAATKTISGTGQDYAGAYNAINPGRRKARSGVLGFMTTVGRESIDEQLGKSDAPFKKFVESAGIAGTTTKIEKTRVHFGDDIFGTLSNMPNGARGELGMSWKAGGAHSMAWEIVKGKPVIFDTQNGKVFQTPNEIGKLADSMASAGFTRLDDVALNKDFLLKWVKDA